MSVGNSIKADVTGNSANAFFSADQLVSQIASWLFPKGRREYDTPKTDRHSFVLEIKFTITSLFKLKEP